MSKKSAYQIIEGLAIWLRKSEQHYEQPRLVDSQACADWFADQALIVEKWLRENPKG